MRRGIAAIAGLACLIGAGCGTMTNRSDQGYFNWDGNFRAHRLYGGVRTDGERIAMSVRDAIRGDPDGSTSRGLNLFRAFVCAVDLPVSAVLDTIFLPFDIRENFRTLREAHEKRLWLPEPATSEPSTEPFSCEPGGA